MPFISLLLGIAGEKTHTFVFPVPDGFMDQLTRGKTPHEGM